MADPRTKVILSTGQKLFPSRDFELMAEGYKEVYRDGNPSITIRCRTRWPGSAEFAINMLGAAGTDSDASSGITRQTPVSFFDVDYEATDVSLANQHTPFLGWWCTGVELVGTHGELSCQDQSSGMLVPALNSPNQLVSGTDFDATTGDLIDSGYDSNNLPTSSGAGFAEYELTFEPLQYEIRTDDEMDALPAPLNTCELSRYVIRRERFGGNNFTLQPGSLYWKDYWQSTDAAIKAKAPILSEAVRPFPNSNYTMTWLNVPGIPRAAIANCIGKVNNTLSGAGAPSGKFDYRPDWQGITWAGGVVDGFLPGTLMFEGASDIVPKITAAGQVLYDITYNFFWRPDGHNKIYRAPTDTFQEVIRVAQKDNPSNEWKGLLDEADFTTLFKLP